MVELKKKVTLKVKSSQETVEKPVKAVSEKKSDVRTQNKGHRSKMIWMLLAGVAVVIVLGYFLLNDSTGSSDTEILPNPVDPVETQAEVTTNTKADILPDSAEQVEKQEDAKVNMDTEAVPNPEEQVENPAEDNANPNAVHNTVEQSEDRKDIKAQSEMKDTQNSTEHTTSTAETITDESLEQLALDVIRGNYGNGLERKEKLGDRYVAVQTLVNRMYREGLVR